MDEPATRYKLSRGLSRGLDVLRALNVSVQGRATCAELSAATGIHRTTVRRIVETLAHEGYVRRSESDDRYQLTLRVRELSEGFTNRERLSSAATPVMGELLQAVVWPSDLSTPDGDSLLVRETTHRFSPLSFHRAMVGRRLPMLLTAAGRAYFCHCGKAEREQIIALIRSTDGAQARLARDDRFIQSLVRKVRADGFGTNTGEWTVERKIGAIAMPVFDGKRVLGALNIVYLTSALTNAQAIERFARPLKMATDKIAIRLRESHADFAS